jgi:PII-like signaling protein
VLAGEMDIGAHSRVHTAKILRLSEDLPVLIEFVDKEDKINTFRPSSTRCSATALSLSKKCTSLPTAPVRPLRSPGTSAE